MSLAARIGVALLVPVLLMVGLAALQVSIVDGLVEDNRSMARVTRRVDAAMLGMREDLARLVEFSEKSRVLEDPGYAEEAARLRARIEADLQELPGLGLSSAERTRVAELEQAWERYRSESAADPPPSMDSLQPSLDTLRGRIDALAAASRERAEAMVQRSEGEAERGARWARLAAFGGVAAGVGLAVVLGRTILVPVRRLTRGTREIADGHFDHRVEPTGPPELAALAGDFNRMAERLGELDRLKEDLLTSVSHDLKAPLASMAETVRLLQDGIPGPLNERQARLLDLNLASGTRLSAMIGNLLGLARLRSGAPLEIVECDAGDLIHTAAVDLSGLAREGRVEVRLELPPDPMVVRWDGPRVIQMIENLLSNAIHHAPAGSVVLVALRSAGSGVELVVEDEGSGVAGEHREAIFERFYRVDARGRGRAGTGLGLAIVRSVAEGHGGAAWVEDAASGGARFVVRMPAEAPE
ncbi:MAG TPA: ATP-binding protein [Gemmatimonadota bacterium]|nr:ATP-binding protein [Gemmatimonadota bacterium]